MAHGDLNIDHFRQIIPCAECDQFLHLELEQFYNYFTDGPVDCTKCGKRVKMLTTVAKAVASPSWPYFLTLLGGTGSWIMGESLYPYKPFVLDIPRYGIPKDAKIITLYIKPLFEKTGDEVILTPLPLLEGTHEQGLVDVAWDLRDEMVFWPIIYPLGYSASPEQLATLRQRGSPIFLLIWWIDAGALEQPDELLVSSYSALRRGDYKRSCLDAHTAVDLALENSVLEYLDQDGSGSIRIQGLAAKLNVLNGLLKVISDRDGIYRSMNFHMPSEVRQGISRLNKKRNEIAHPRRDERPLACSEAADLLATGFLAVKYVTWARAILAKKDSNAEE